MIDFDLGVLIRTLRRFSALLIAAAVSLFAVAAGAQEKAQSLFDGKSLDGWETLPGERSLWKVTDGTIAGGSLTRKVPHNSFLATRRLFHNFDLRLTIRVSGTEGFINSGIQIRSVRKPRSHEMMGYQVDAGKGWWGKLYDESRRNKVIGQAADLAAVIKAVKEGDWNEYRIRAEGPRIRSWINDVPALDYTETDKHVALDGHIGIQVHGGGKALVQVKDVTIEELPPTPNAPTWKKRKAAESKARAKRAAKAKRPKKVGSELDIRSANRSPEDELMGFTVPEGFAVELVAAESVGIGKFVAVAFDARGRMWTMTALEYPVDSNENPESSRRLFANGGQDKVLVYDEPFGAAAPSPRVFAEGLAMPLGILPYKDGVFVQYGHDIRFYRDTDGDGKADEHEVILTGFGTEDSHLFPHQFTRAPGGWILTAQGLFNRSTVRRPGGVAFANGVKEVIFNQCKLARFNPDGSLFENLTAGPNNIWGLTISREGETWLQEANDLGYPIIPYEAGGHYRTGSQERLRPYQPLMPAPLLPPQMGGTGLSGLALADDRNGWPAPWGTNGASAGDPRMFYLANPIISRIQAIRATPKNGRYDYEKLPDFLISEDPRFRPVAIQFGPDGCLYIVDWYNKIINHNGVPRNHPERDKTHGRIWRIRHISQSRTLPPNLAKLPAHALPAHLGSPNARTADLAWQEIVDRRATELVPELTRLIENRSAPADKRLGALWALEGLATVPASLLVSLAKDPNANIRHEAVRVAGAQPRGESEFLAVAEPLVDDPAPKVRAALGDALRRVRFSDLAGIALMARLGRAPLAGNSWESYDREFERYLARWAMELNAEAVAMFLNSPAGKAMPLETRLLAKQALAGRDAAVGLAQLVPQLKRPLSEAEIRTLVSHFTEPTVAATLKHALERPSSRAATLRALLVLRTKIDTSALDSTVAQAARSLWKQDRSTNGRQLALHVAGAFRVQAMEQDIAALAAAAETTRDMKLAALRALREIGVSSDHVLVELAATKGEDLAVRSAALAALADSQNQETLDAVAGRLLDLKSSDRQAVVHRMASHRKGALALLAAIDQEDLYPEDLPLTALEAMRTLLPNNAAVKSLCADVAGRVQRVLRLAGGNADFARLPVGLAGPFTVETWVRLSPSISNLDGILGAAGLLDMNFHDETFRIWVAGQNDIVVAKRKTTADAWAHFAATRDADGVFRIYINGELEAESLQRNTNLFDGLNIGRTTPSAGGTDGELMEYRIWNVARSPRQIRDNFDRSFVGDKRPDGLIHYFAGDDWGQLSGNARDVPTLEAPKLLTAEQAREQAEKFATFRALAEKPGSPALGKTLFATHCLNCHSEGGTGGNIGPPLDGIGLKGTEALLRNILTPSAAMEGGYRNFRVLTNNGQLLQGLLVSQDADAIVLRQPNTADQRLPQSDIERADYTSVSVMPTGLLESLEPQQVSDLFSYLLLLKQGQTR